MRLVLELPEELSDLLGEDPGRETLEALVMNLVRRGDISRGKAAELLGLAAQDLPSVMERHGVDWIDLTPQAQGRLTGKPVSIADVLEEAPTAPAPPVDPLAALRLDPARPALDASTLKTFRRHGRPVTPRPGGPTAEEVVAEDRGRGAR